MMKTHKIVMSIALLLVLALSMTGIAAAQDEATARPWIGIAIGDSDAGIVISQISPDSPAAESDLAVDDVIVSLNGDDVASAEALIEALQAFAPEDIVTLGVMRGEESLDIDITLGEFPEELNTVRPGDRDGAQIFGRASVLPMLGVVFDEVDEGWEVTQVMPMADSDFEEGDIITAINGESVNELDFRAAIESLLSEETIEVTLLRDGEAITVEIEPVMGGAVQVFPGPASGRIMLGVRYHPLDEAFAANLGIETTEGALVTEVLPETPAAEADLMAGDIITAVNDTALDGETNLSAALSAFEDGDVVTLTVLRAGEAITVDVTLTVQENRIFEFSGDGNDFRVFPFPGGRGFGRDGRDGRGGRGFDFDGENFEDFFEGVMPEGAVSITCQNSDGDTVFSFEFSGTDGFNMEDFQLPDMDSGLNFEELDCQVNSDDTPDAVPNANDGDL